MNPAEVINLIETLCNQQAQDLPHATVGLCSPRVKEAMEEFVRPAMEQRARFDRPGPMFFAKLVFEESDCLTDENVYFFNNILESTLFSAKIKSGNTQGINCETVWELP